MGWGGVGCDVGGGEWARRGAKQNVGGALGGCERESGTVGVRGRSEGRGEGGGKGGEIQDGDRTRGRVGRAEVKDVGGKVKLSYFVNRRVKRTQNMIAWTVKKGGE